MVARRSNRQVDWIEVDGAGLTVGIGSFANRLDASTDSPVFAVGLDHRVRHRSVELKIARGQTMLRSLEQEAVGEARDQNEDISEWDQAASASSEHRLVWNPLADRVGRAGVPVDPSGGVDLWTNRRPWWAR